ncbi:uncharacterized protein B0H18DRAFT_1120106 [Fomitopsis serialis]|uniref:uncharacterized protein n=1 Tax=Fomitopsis serialis TaxID=139415 RepID=UPI0020089BF5|nr:uncharacterized protein B0H18DRAFT_1120106 [Neoantrodia serialis]KAH9924023.1 hypothetical protein B0H18DRAFT_1120106 [Neoantrodia serialis]
MTLPAPGNNSHAESHPVAGAAVVANRPANPASEQKPPVTESLDSRGQDANEKLRDMVDAQPDVVLPDSLTQAIATASAIVSMSTTATTTAADAPGLAAATEPSTSGVAAQTGDATWRPYNVHLFPVLSKSARPSKLETALRLAKLDEQRWKETQAYLEEQSRRPLRPRRDDADTK